nr:hypothetical protein [Tanacetum cinerariifolium]
MEFIKGTTKEETSSSKELVMVKTRLQLIKHRLIKPWVTKLRFIKPQFLNHFDFNISFADALILMPKFGPTIKSLLTNKEKLFEFARTPLNEHCLAVLLKKLPKRWGTVNKLSLPELSPTYMTLELVDRLISRLVGVAEDVFVKEAVTFNLDQTSRYFANYDAMSVNRIDLIDVACEEYSQEVLGFSVSETNAFLAIDDEPISPEIDESYYDSEGDILLLEEFLNDDPSSPPIPPQELK